MYFKYSNYKMSERYDYKKEKCGYFPGFIPFDYSIVPTGINGT